MKVWLNFAAYRSFSAWLFHAEFREPGGNSNANAIIVTKWHVATTGAGNELRIAAACLEMVWSQAAGIGAAIYSTTDDCRGIF
jgi:hypothetical protein